MKNRYKISELAKIVNISSQTLHFYHKKGILIPEYIDEKNGYRYYSSSQIWDLFFILILKKSGFSLEDIKNYIKVKNPIKNIEFLEEKICDIDLKIEQLKKSKNALIEKVACLKEISSNLEEKVEVVIRKSLRVHFIKIMNPYDEHEIAGVYNKLERFAIKNNIKNIVYAVKVKKDSIHIGSNFEINEIGVLMPENSKNLDSEFIKDNLCVKLRHKATYDMIKLSYETLYKFTKDSNYEIIEDSIELGSEVVIPLEDGFGGVVDIYIPVKKIIEK
ncbi:MAG: MerR family transcriptional regulator [Cetobacterium sp.]